jgi:L-arabinokinase
VNVPAGYRFYGIDSGVRHAVSGSDYGTVRAAAFMGYRIIADLVGLAVTADGARVRVDDDRWRGYLANISPAEFAERFADRLPVRMRGGEFLARYGATTDTVTRVEPTRWYPVRQATSHPVYENERVMQFAERLSAGIDGAEAAAKMGARMFESHASYSACGLGSAGTDRLVELVAEAGPSQGVFGAKITGGGSGGTVCVFGTDSARSVVHHIAREYGQETGLDAVVFDSWGPGVEVLGTLDIPRGSSLRGSGLRS